MSVDSVNERTLTGIVGRHERVPMGTRGCKKCVFTPEHTVHQGAEVLSMAQFRDRRRPA